MNCRFVPGTPAQRPKVAMPGLVPRCHPGLVPGSSHARQADPGVEPGFPGHSGPRNKSGVTTGGGDVFAHGHGARVESLNRTAVEQVRA